MKVFIAIPTQGMISAEFMACVIQFISNPNIRYRMSSNRSPGVGISRNILTQEFLESDCDKLLMVDSDMIFQPWHVSRIASHDEQVVGGLYAKKDRDGNVCCERLKGVEPIPDVRGLVPLRYIGTGFLCTTRELIELMIKKYPEIEYVSEYTQKKMHDFWSVGVHQGMKRYLTEDWWFCQRAIDLGYKVWGDNKVQIQHEGRAIYPLELNERPEATA